MNSWPNPMKSASECWKVLGESYPCTKKSPSQFSQPFTAQEWHLKHIRLSTCCWHIWWCFNASIWKMQPLTKQKRFNTPEKIKPGNRLKFFVLSMIFHFMHQRTNFFLLQLSKIFFFRLCFQTHDQKTFLKQMSSKTFRTNVSSLLKASSVGSKLIFASIFFGKHV